MSQTGTSCTWGAYWECEHWFVCRFDLKVRDRNHILLIGPDPGGRDVRYMPGENITHFIKLKFLM